MKTLAYLRKSSKDKQHISFDLQKAEIEKKYKIDKYYTDEVSGGANIEKKAGLLRCLDNLKKGDTLHSKFMVVDDTFASVGSFNLHPRSLYYDSEMALNMIDEDAATKLREQFDKDTTADKAKEVKSRKDLEIESTWYNRFIRKYFFRHL